MTQSPVKRVVPVRSVNYRGDQRQVVGSGQVSGPDRRGIFWHATHAEYDKPTHMTRITFRPVPREDMERLMGGPEALNALMEQVSRGAFGR